MLSSKLPCELVRLISFVDYDILVLTIAYFYRDGQDLFWVGCEALAEGRGLVRLLQIVVQIVIFHLLSRKVTLVL